MRAGRGARPSTGTTASTAEKSVEVLQIVYEERVNEVPRIEVRELIKQVQYVEKNVTYGQLPLRQHTLRDSGRISAGDRKREQLGGKRLRQDVSGRGLQR